MVRISKDAKPGDLEAAMKMMKEGAGKMEKKRARVGLGGAMVGKVQWAKGAYGAMQNLPAGHSLLERSMIRDFAVAICRREGRRIVSAKDVTDAYQAIFGE